jgi:hypothetical protein
MYFFSLRIYEIFYVPISKLPRRIFMKSSSYFVLSFLACSLITQLFANEIRGPKVLVGNGYARTFVALNSQKVPSAIGIILSKDALVALPALDQSYSLKLPA